MLIYSFVHGIIDLFHFNDIRTIRFRGVCILSLVDSYSFLMIQIQRLPSSPLENLKNSSVAVMFSDTDSLTEHTRHFTDVIQNLPQQSKVFVLTNVRAAGKSSLPVQERKLC